MKKIVIDGIEYEAAPEVINRLNKEIKRADDSEKALNTAKEENSKLQAKVDEAKDELDKLKKVDTGAEIQKAVTSRLALVSQSTPHLDEETVKKIADMSDDDIKKSVILKHWPEAKLDEKDSTYIQARYDSAIETGVKNDQALANQRQQLNKPSATHTDDKVDADKSRENYRKDLYNDWKDGKEKK